MKTLDLMTIFNKVAALEEQKKTIVSQIVSQSSFAQKINKPEITDAVTLDMVAELAAIDAQIREYLSLEIQVDAATAKQITGGKK